MNYFLDTEFIEGPQKKTFLGIEYGETKPTIDLISIGIVSEDGREFYAISKDFNLKEAWNRWQPKSIRVSDTRILDGKEYWIRENVLKPIFDEFIIKERDILLRKERFIGYAPSVNYEFTYNNFKRLISKYGRTNKEIKQDIIIFTICGPYEFIESEIKFYADYGSYDWVVFCWLFGKMIDLPDGFPMFFHDLKVMFNEAAVNYYNDKFHHLRAYDKLDHDENYKIRYVKNMDSYPKNDSHHALKDAKHDLELYNFILYLQS